LAFIAFNLLPKSPLTVYTALGRQADGRSHGGKIAHEGPRHRQPLRPAVGKSGFFFATRAPEGKSFPRGHSSFPVSAQQRPFSLQTAPHPTNRHASRSDSAISIAYCLSHKNSKKKLDISTNNRL
jgi:hypothetical protein